MKRDLLKGLCLALGIIFAFSVLIGPVLAAEKKEPNKVVKFFRGLFHWPVSATKESAEVIIDTSKKGTDVITQEGKDIGSVLTGDVQKTDEVIVGPVKGTTETITSAAEGAVKVPGKATEEAFPSE
ncbi:MAG: hypothetical protein AMJ78_07020 [Omnitrophica WOR_2 bacterium SM23_29]|nr:MAG: hypothetical protein AMJ78_07020 [Omnitrophica WOR_2 bacterium SM23_29]